MPEKPEEDRTVLHVYKFITIAILLFFLAVISTFFCMIAQGLNMERLVPIFQCLSLVSTVLFFGFGAIGLIYLLCGGINAEMIWAIGVVAAPFLVGYLSYTNSWFTPWALAVAVLWLVGYPFIRISSIASR